MVTEDGTMEVYTTPERLRHRAGRSAEPPASSPSAEVTMIASTEAELDAETAPKLDALSSTLPEDLDDVQEVYPQRAPSPTKWR